MPILDIQQSCLLLCSSSRRNRPFCAGDSSHSGGINHRQLGAVVPDVLVRATNLATNVSRESKSDSSGNYTIPFLPAGDYTVAASITGFQTQTVDRLTLQVQQTARMDFKLTVGSINEKVTVAASARSSADRERHRRHCDRFREDRQLPLNGRNFIQLAQLVPGVQAGTPGSITVRRGRGSVGQTDAAYGSTAASANGQRDTANRFFLDGIETMDYDAMTYSFSPSIDSIAEFKVETSTYSAESGSAPGAQVNMITKSGANALTGTLWEFNRNDAFTQSYDAIANKSVTAARLNRNQFGANIGGPVVLPKIYHGKDKTFFFFNWESGYAAQGAAPTPLTIPPAVIRTGELFSVSECKNQDADLGSRSLLGQPFAGNIIPASRLSQQSLAFLQFVPQPNLNATAINNYLTTPIHALPYQRNYTARIDHTLSSQDRLSGRYVFNDTYEAGIPIWGHDERNNLGRTQNAQRLLKCTRFTPALINECRGGWHQFNESEVFGTTNDPAYDVVGKMDLPLVSRLPVEYGPPTITISGTGRCVQRVQLAAADRTAHALATPSIQLLDTVSWQRGTPFPQIRRRIGPPQRDFQQARAPRGAFAFDGDIYRVGTRRFHARLHQDRQHQSHSHQYRPDGITQAYYVNDDWKTTTRLTINLGLRYDYFRAVYADRTTSSPISIRTVFCSPTSSLRRTPPTAAACSSPTAKTSVPASVSLIVPPSAATRLSAAVTESITRPKSQMRFLPWPKARKPLPAQASPATSAGSPTFSSTIRSLRRRTSGALTFAVSNDQNLKDSYIQQWNFNIQKKLPAKIVLDVGYVGSKGTHLIVTYPDLNMPLTLVDPRTPGLASVASRRPDQLFQRAVTADKSVGNSIYHSLQVKGERRLGQGFTFLTAYTCAKSISGPSDIGGQVGGGFYIGTPQDIYNARGDRSVSGFDLKQRFVTTVLYDVPFFHGLHGVGKYALDGWQVSAIMTAQSGFPTPNRLRPGYNRDRY